MRHVVIGSVMVANLAVLLATSKGSFDLTAESDRFEMELAPGREVAATAHLSDDVVAWASQMVVRLNVTGTVTEPLNIAVYNVVDPESPYDELIKSVILDGSEGGAALSFSADLDVNPTNKVPVNFLVVLMSDEGAFSGTGSVEAIVEGHSNDLGDGAFWVTLDQ